jgi:hypothetical protein
VLVVLYIFVLWSVGVKYKKNIIIGKLVLFMDDTTKRMLWVMPYFLVLAIGAAITFAPLLIFIFIGGAVVFIVGWAMEHISVK